MGSLLVFSSIYSSCSICCKLCHYPNLFLGSSKLGSFCYKKHNNSYYPISPPCLKFNDVITTSKLFMNGFPNKRKVVLCLSDSQIKDADSSEVGDDEEEEEQQSGENLNRELVEENEEDETYIPFKVEKENEKLGIIAACFVGLLTGVAVVLFNNTVHELRDFFWDDIPSRGASWLRERPIEETWIRVISVPTCGGIIVAMLNGIRGALDDTPSQSKGFLVPSDNVKAAFRPVLKALAASITLGSGNSLGPEGPSVEIGASVAKGISTVFGFSNQSRTSIVAAGSAAGIASGFNAAVAGCFFAVESVLWPSPAADSAPTLTNTTSMVILSAVIASIISEVGLGSQPAFKVPEYDFRSPSELPLYLVLGILCGLVSLTLSRCTSYAITVVDKSHKVIGIPKTVFPILGGLSVGLIALAYPEILYWGFENVNLLLESKPFVKGLSAELLLQLVGVKIITTSLCRASGLVGGYYAPSLFIGASTGMAYGKFASYAISNSDPFFHLSILEVASPQAYGLVGMAATLAGVCQVPLTAVLLLFELTQDYRIVLPLLGAVGLSSWIASGQVIKRDSRSKDANLESKTKSNPQISRSSFNSSGLSSNSALAKTTSNSEELCELESSLCLDDSVTEFSALEERIFVSQAMRIRFITVVMSTFLKEAVTLMFAEKQSCAMIVDNENALIGFLTLDDIQEFSKLAKARYGQDEVEKLTVFEMCNSSEGKCRVLWTATPDMNLFSAQNIMKAIGVSQIPVVSDHEDHRRNLVGLLDKECIDLTCRVVATQEALSLSSKLEKK